MLKIIKLLLFALAAIIVAVFAANNNQAVSLNLHPLPIQFEVSLFVIVFAAILFGVLLAGTITSLRLLYWRRVAKNALKKLDNNEEK